MDSPRLRWPAALLAAWLLLPLAGGVAVAEGDDGEVAPQHLGKLDGVLRDAVLRGGAAPDDLVAEVSDPDAFARRAAALGLVAEVEEGSRIAAVKGARGALRELAGAPEVQRLGADLVVQPLLDGSVPAMAVDRARRDFGASGEGIGIAILDTGVDASHPDLGGALTGWFDAVNGLAEPYDDHGHGTHVAGIALGRGSAEARYTGVAPGADLVAVKVLGTSGGTFAQILRGLEWVEAQRAALGIRVVSMSLGADADCRSRGDDLLSLAVDRLASRGLLVVVAAGNSGPNACIALPGAARGALTVGALRDPSEGGLTMARFSARGPTGDLRTKPDLVAPGAALTAPRAGGGYTTMQGTSMATPFVAGAAALLFEASPALSAAQARSALLRTAVDLGAPGADVETGAGALQPYAALRDATGESWRALPRLPRAATLTGTVAEGATAAFPLVVPAGGTVGVALTFGGTPWGAGCSPWAWPDLDLYVRSPAGARVGWSESWECRQEQVAFEAPAAGTYTVEVVGYAGSGAFRLDTSVPALDGQAPVVRLATPAATLYENTPLAVEAAVTDDDVIAAVRGVVRLGQASAEVAFAEAAPGRWTAAVAPLGPGSHALTVLAADASGHEGSAALAFRVLAGRVAVLSNVSVEALSPVSVRVRWTTDLPSTSQVMYGSPAPRAASPLNRTLTTEHEVLLTRLAPARTYAFQPASASGTVRALGDAASLRMPSDLRALALEAGAVNRTLALAARLADAGTGAPLEGRALAFRLDGRAVGTAFTDADGRASWQGLAPPGRRGVSVHFAGEPGYRASANHTTLTIAPVATALDVEAARLGTRPAVRLALRDADGLPVAGQRIEVLAGSARVRGATNATGEALLAVALPPGEAPVQARFAAANGYLASAGAADLTWAPVEPTLTANLTFASGLVRAAAALAAEGAPVAGVRVAFLEDGRLRASATTGADGVARAAWRSALPDTPREAAFAGAGLVTAAAATMLRV